MFLEGNAETSEPGWNHLALVTLKAAPAAIRNRVRIVTSYPADRFVGRAGILFYRFFTDHAYVIGIIH